MYQPNPQREIVATMFPAGVRSVPRPPVPVEPTEWGFRLPWRRRPAAPGPHRPDRGARCAIPGPASPSSATM
jgi:hypothetical protein